ncbi:MAG: hypothetical protein QOJ07_3219 [Thermoleophilaceae bacterium]|jgi:hypothetical protein|nr:hypothetical protein [Thermoleophilaceae bacterium]
MSDRIELTTPVGRPWDPVIRLVLGGIADRLDLGFEELDDLQLAVERLLAEAHFEDRVTLSFEILERSVRLSIGPLLTGAVADALQGPPARPGELTLGRILQTVVDSYGVEKVEDGHMVVRLEKAVRRV